MVVEEPTEFLGVFESEAEFGAGRSGEESGAGESLAVEDHVVVVFAEFAEPGIQRSEPELSALFPELSACEGDGLVEVGVVLDRLGEGVADHPVDFRVGVFILKRGEDGGGAADVTKRAGADDEDSLWGDWIGHLGG